MGDIHDDLREVMGLLGKATPGPWAHTKRNDPEAPASIASGMDRGMAYAVAMCPRFRGDDWHKDADAIVSAVAFLRRHGPALLARQEGEDGATAGPPVAAEKAESVCVHCFSPPHMWGMICCNDYWNDPRTEFLTETQANARRAARSGGWGGNHG